VELANIRKGAATETQLERAAGRASLRLEKSPSRYGHSVTVQGSWDEYLRTRSRNLRSNYNRAWRRCREVGPTRVVRFPEEDIGFDRALESVFRVLDQSWKGPPESASPLRRFFAELATELYAAGMLVIRILFVNEKPLAYLFDIDHRRRFTAFHTAYDLSAQQVWAGILVLGDGVHHAHERGYECYDLAGEARVHITQWANHRNEFNDLRLRSPRLLSRVKLPLYRAVRSRRQARARQETESWKAAEKAAGRRGGRQRE
jgi:CelD/BcsL family acetyltransferase involved in cellulose biosynthesis